MGCIVSILSPLLIKKCCETCSPVNTTKYVCQAVKSHSFCLACDVQQNIGIISMVMVGAPVLI